MTATYTGTPAAPGIGMGTVFVYRPCHSGAILDAKPDTAMSAPTLAKTASWDEWQHFLAVQSKVDEELEQLESVSSRLLGDIFSTQRAILHDKTLLDAVRSAIYQSSATAAQATRLSITELTNLFRGLEDEYFATHASEIVDIGQRLLAHLEQKKRSSQLSYLSPDTVLITEELTLADVMEVNTDHVCAVALVNSTPTAHVAILARSLELPMVCALDRAILDAPSGCIAIVDGNSGSLVVDPSDHESLFYTDSKRYHQKQQRLAEVQSQTVAITQDGIYVPVYANVNDADAVQAALMHGADGVGLLRTEFLFLQQETPPSVEEQARCYQQIRDCLAAGYRELGQNTLSEEIVEAYLPEEPLHRAVASERLQTLTIRLLDAGGDKPLPFIPETQKSSSFLGRRGIRLLLAHPNLLDAQIEAILLTAKRGQNLRVMLPMVHGIDEIRAVKQIITRKEAELFKEEERPEIALGILVEVPAAALMADRLAPEVDFFSIGTNDLTQYVLAADRSDANASNLIDPLHPAVLQLISLVCHSASAARIPVSICGTIASDPGAVPLLLGLGITELSANPSAIPLLKQAVRQCDLLRARQLAEQTLRCSTAAQVRSLTSH